MEFYVYAYVREDGSPYYIGKGKGYRAWDKAMHKITHTPTQDRIIIMESNLTEIGAFALERRYIRWYGRKDNETGILRNKTDGGEGISGRIFSEETRKKISESKKGLSLSEETKKKISASKMGKTYSDEIRKRNSEGHRGQIPWIKGRNHSDETKKKISETLKNKGN